MIPTAPHRSGSHSNGAVRRQCCCSLGCHRASSQTTACGLSMFSDEDQQHSPLSPSALSSAATAVDSHSMAKVIAWQVCLLFITGKAVQSPYLRRIEVRIRHERFMAHDTSAGITVTYHILEDVEMLLTYIIDRMCKGGMRLGFSACKTMLDRVSWRQLSLSSGSDWHRLLGLFA